MQKSIAVRFQPANLNVRCATVRNVTTTPKGRSFKNLTGSCHFCPLGESYACMRTSAPKNANGSELKERP